MGKSWNERRAWTCGTPVSWRILFATCTSAQNEKHMLTCVSQHCATLYTMTTVDQAASCDEHIKWTTFKTQGATVHNNTASVTHSVGGHTYIHITLHACCLLQHLPLETVSVLPVTKPQRWLTVYIFILFWTVLQHLSIIL